MSSDLHILITGAGGFLGGHVTAALKKKGLAVTATMRGAQGKGEVALDICSREQVEYVFRAVRPTHVVHCAAYGVNFADRDPRAAIDVNVLGSLSVMETAAKQSVQRFLHVGSCFEYGSQPGRISESACLKPTGVYGVTKAAATLLLADRASALGVSLMVVRPFGMWGPGEAHYRLVPQIVDACRRRVPLDLTPCDVVRDYTYVEDMAEDLIALLLLPEFTGEPMVNLGSGRPVLLRDFVLRIAGSLGGTELMRFGRRSHRPAEMASVVADVNRMRALLGDTPRTPMAEGLRRMGAKVVAAA